MFLNELEWNYTVKFQFAYIYMYILFTFIAVCPLTFKGTSIYADELELIE